MNIIKNDFKTIQLVCFNSALDSKETRVYRYLLSKVIVSHTNQYPTKLDMSVRLEALYGALLSAHSELNGNINTIGISLTIANPKLVSDDTLMTEAISFFKQVIYDHESFDEAIFQDEKRILIEQWQSLKDNKAAYANYRFSSLFKSPDLSGYPISGTLKDIRNITSDQLYDYYKHVFLHENMYVIINGHIEDNDHLRDLAMIQNDKQIHFETVFRKPRRLKETIEETSMNQAIIKMGYLLPIYRFDDAYMATLIASVIVGGYPESRLFKVIREARALCYDVSAIYDPYKGILTISSGVSIETLDEAKLAIKTLIDDIVLHGFTEEELQMAKRYIIHQLKAGLDHQTYFTRRAYYHYLTKHDEPITLRIQMVENVTLNDINTVIQKLQLDTIYVLRGALA